MRHCILVHKKVKMCVTEMGIKGSDGNEIKPKQMWMACPICPAKTLRNADAFLLHTIDRHFKDRLESDLPQEAPFICPNSNCKTTFTSLNDLVKHYGKIHKMALKLLNERAGITDSDDDAILKQYERGESSLQCCPICKSKYFSQHEALLWYLVDLSLIHI